MTDINASNRFATGQGAKDMWRAFFMAIGVSLCVLGAECMVIEKAVLAESIKAESPYLATESHVVVENDLPVTKERKVLVPPEWAPWGLLAGGVMIVLYAATVSGGGD